MELIEVLDQLKSPEKLIDPRVVDELLFYVSSWISELEETLNEVDWSVSLKSVELTERYKSVAKARVYLEVDEVYKKQRELEMRIRTLKGFRSNLRRRYEILSTKTYGKY